MDRSSRFTHPPRYSPTESDRPYSRTRSSAELRPEDSISNHPPRQARRRGRRSKPNRHNVSGPSTGTQSKNFGRSRAQSTPLQHSLGIAVFPDHQLRPSERWLPGQKRVSVDVRYQSDELDHSCHAVVTKQPGQTWTTSILHPRFANEQSRRKSGGSQPRPRRPDRNYRQRNHTTRFGDDEKEREQGGNKEEATRRHRSGDGSMMTFQSTKNAEGEYGTDFCETMVSRVATEGAATGRNRSSRSRNKSSLPETYGATVHRAHDGPARTDSASVSHGYAGRLRRQGDLSTHEMAIQTHPCVGDIDSAFKNHFSSPASTPESTDEKRSRPEHTTRRSPNKHPSRSERTELGGHPPRHHSSPDDGSHYAYEKSKKTTTYRSGCCTIL